VELIESGLQRDKLLWRKSCTSAIQYSYHCYTPSGVQMKAYLLKHPGPPEDLKISEVPDLFPEAGEVRVRIQAIGINYAEILSRKGMYSWAPPLPYIPGMEGYGEIDMVGSSVTGRKPGDKVIFGAQYGAYAEGITLPAWQALPAVPSFIPEENAAFLVNYMTAWVSLFEQARIQPGEKVLLQAAMGGVGTAAVQMALKHGCVVIGTAGSEDKVSKLREMGVHLALNYRNPDWDKEVRKHYPEGVDVALVLVSGDAYRNATELLAVMGRLVIAGFAGFSLNKWNPFSVLKAWKSIPRPDIRKMMKMSQGYFSTHIGHLLSHKKLLLRLWEDMSNFVKENQIKPRVGAIFSFSEMAKAHSLIENRFSTGKVIIKTG
jgi:NADPH:quinone reductase